MKLFSTFFLCALLPFANLVSGATPSKPMNDAEIEKAVNALLARMTFEEKVGQMSQRNYWKGVDLRGNGQRVGLQGLLDLRNLRVDLSP